MSQTIRITAFRDGYRRAGMAHSTQPVEHPADRFTAEQLAQLRADQRLLVEEVDQADEPAEPSTGSGDGDDTANNESPAQPAGAAVAKKAAAKKSAK